MCCTKAEAAAYKKDMLSVVKTHVAPSYAVHPRTGDAYAAYNKPEAVIDWLDHVTPKGEALCHTLHSSSEGNSNSSHQLTATVTTCSTQQLLAAVSYCIVLQRCYAQLLATCCPRAAAFSWRVCMQQRSSSTPSHLCCRPLQELHSLLQPAGPWFFLHS
jgi:hypothetical protein